MPWFRVLLLRATVARETAALHVEGRRRRDAALHSFIHLLYMKPTDYIITTLKIKTSYQLSAHWQIIAGQISLLSNAIKLHKNKM